jgi:hypothetical protein
MNYDEGGSMDERTLPDWACRGCGYERKACTCPDPATARDKAQALAYVIAAVALILIVTVGFCLSMHGGMT